MEKSPDAFRTISEVAEWLDVPTHVLRFWESRFTQIKPVKRAGGRRYYRPADMELLGGIKRLLHDDGLTIRGVQKLLREDGVRHVASMSPPLDSSAEEAGEPANVVRLKPQKTPAPQPDAASQEAEALPDEVFARWPFSEDQAEPAVDGAAGRSLPAAQADAQDAVAARGGDATQTAPPSLPETIGRPDPSAPRCGGMVLEPATSAFLADVPETDPEDDDSGHAVAQSLLTVLGAADDTHIAALRAVHDKLVALRQRMGDPRI